MCHVRVADANFFILNTSPYILFSSWNPWNIVEISHVQCHIPIFTVLVFSNLLLSLLKTLISPVGFVNEKISENYTK